MIFAVTTLTIHCICDFDEKFFLPLLLVFWVLSRRTLTQLLRLLTHPFLVSDHFKTKNLIPPRGTISKGVTRNVKRIQYTCIVYNVLFIHFIYKKNAGTLCLYYLDKITVFR